MFPDATMPVPGSLISVLAVFGPLFTAPTFRTFTMLACGFLAQTGKRTVCGMLAGADLARSWKSLTGRIRSSPVPGGVPMTSAWPSPAWSWRCWVPAGTRWPWRSMTRCSAGGGRRSGLPRAFHDGSAPGPDKTGYGNNWVIAAIVVKLPMLARPVAVPVLAKLVIKHTSSASRLWLARRMTQMLADGAARPGHPRHRRFRLRRRGTEKAPARRHLDHPAAQRRRLARAAARSHG